MGSDKSNPKLNPPQPMRILGRFGFNFVHKLDWILDLSNFTDSYLGLGSALTLSWVQVWTWIQIVLQVGLDSESIKFNGFGLGLNLFYGLKFRRTVLYTTYHTELWIVSCFDLDSDLDLNVRNPNPWIQIRI